MISISTAKQRAIDGNSGPIKNDIEFSLHWWLNQFGISALCPSTTEKKSLRESYQLETLAGNIVEDECGCGPINMWLVAPKQGGRFVGIPFIS